MPVYLRYRGYKIYFWSNENGEPIHFHISEGEPTGNSTKVWILKDGSFKLANNNGKIPLPILRRITDMMLDYIKDYEDIWLRMHKEIHYYE